MPRISFERWPSDRRRPFGTALIAIFVIAVAPFIAAWADFDSVRARLQRTGFMLGEDDATKLHSILLQSEDMEVANRGHLPSTEALPKSAIDDGLPTISIVTDERGLTSERNGILTHPLESGRKWERAATISYFEGGELEYETPAGLRLHGGRSRKGSVKSYQLVFRRSYAGFPRSKPGVFFDGTSDPYLRLVLINTSKVQRFLNPLALEIAERAGCLTSKSQPVRLFLNGTPAPCGYFLLEHQSREFLLNRFGHDKFEWVRLKGEHRDSPAFAELEKWVKQAPAPLTMATAAQRFDLDDLCAWVLAISLCGTTDSDQGGYFRDQRNPQAKWRCVAWDMDGSFNHGDPVHDITVRFDRVKGLRARLFNRLSAEDPAFRVHFQSFARRFLEQDFNAEQRNVLIEKYRRMARSDIFPKTENNLYCLDNTERFLTERAQRYFADYDKFVAEGAVRELREKHRK